MGESRLSPQLILNVQNRFNLLVGLATACTLPVACVATATVIAAGSAIGVAAYDAQELSLATFDAVCYIWLKLGKALFFEGELSFKCYFFHKLNSF